MRYDACLINQPWEDPGLLVQINRSREYWLFDCGDLRNLGAGLLCGVTHIFITHTHIDHFIGFDTVMRMNLNESKELKIYGPPGLASNVGARLQGYGWNLTENSRFSIKCFELYDDKVVSFVFRARSKFAEDAEERHSFAITSREVRLEDGTLLRFAPAVHGITCLCYSITEPLQARIDKEKLKRSGLPAGPWIGELAGICSGTMDGPRTLKVGSEERTADSLRSLIYCPKPARCAYITDTVFNRTSMESMRWVGQGADVLWCEACYRHKDLEKAKTNLHMTSRQAGRIAKELEAERLYMFHYSRRYRGELWPHIQEARENFANTAPPPIFPLTNEDGSSSGQTAE